MGLEMQAPIDLEAGLETHPLPKPAQHEEPEELEEEAVHIHELSPEESLAGISLLELAEVLDQHRNWVESGGDSGAKADLSGVNLSKADLTGVNLQGAPTCATRICWEPSCAAPI
jgi:uncharacterized protein YjbI with pentapeptide repeats